MTEYNVLVLAAGRRVELVKSFIDATKRLQIKSDIIAADCSNTAPALYFADKKVILPPIHENRYTESIIETCLANRISLIVPTIDTDLQILADKKEEIQDKTHAIVLVSNKATIKICRNKIETHKHLNGKGFDVPKLYTEEEATSCEDIYPLFIKPVFGSSSIGAHKVDSIKDFLYYKAISNDIIIQEYLEGEEFTVDAFFDFNGALITLVPRLRLATRGGEISKGVVVKDREIMEDAKRMLATLDFIGQVTIQLIRTNNGIRFIEINPRFGGGAPMSIKSGADSCENLYRLLMGETLVYNEEYTDGLTFLRYDESICIDDNLEIVDDKISGF